MTEKEPVAKTKVVDKAALKKMRLAKALRENLLRRKKPESGKEGKN